MEIQVFEANNGDCPYLDQRRWLTYMFKADTLDGGVYETLLDYGFRRSGLFFYKNKCPGCHACVPLRVPVNQFKLSKSQKRVLRRNSDIKIIQNPVQFDEESYLLYERYSEWKHHTDSNADSYKDFLISSAVNTQIMKYYRGAELIGIGWVDLLPNSISSVYFAFSQTYHKRSLGVFSVLKEIELALETGRSFLHLGFWVDHCQAMAYKTSYQPYQLLLDGEWKSPEGNAEKLEIIDTL